MSRTRIRFVILVLAASGLLLTAVVHTLNKCRAISVVLSALRQKGVVVSPIFMVPMTGSRVFITSELRGFSQYGVALPPKGNTHDNMGLITELAELGSLHSVSCTSPGVTAPGSLPIETAFQGADPSGAFSRRLRTVMPTIQVYANPPAKVSALPGGVPQSAPNEGQ